jgi:hypothetical protein
MQEGAKAQAKSQGGSYQENRETAANMDQRNRFPSGSSQEEDSSEAIESRDDLRSGGEDVEQGMSPGPGRGEQGRGKVHPHSPR